MTYETKQTVSINPYLMKHNPPPSFLNGQDKIGPSMAHHRMAESDYLLGFRIRIPYAGARISNHRGVVPDTRVRIRTSFDKERSVPSDRAKNGVRQKNQTRDSLSAIF